MPPDENKNEDVQPEDVNGNEYNSEDDHFDPDAPGLQQNGTRRTAHKYAIKGILTWLILIRITELILGRCITCHGILTLLKYIYDCVT